MRGLRGESRNQPRGRFTLGGPVKAFSGMCCEPHRRPFSAITVATETELEVWEWGGAAVHRVCVCEEVFTFPVIAHKRLCLGRL